MQVFLKYLVLQLPGWFAIGLVLIVVRTWVDFSPTLIPLVIGGLVLKDLLLFPRMRHAYASGASTWVGAERLVGARGIVAERIVPEGWVRLGAELWRAEAVPGEGPIEAGTAVRVREVRGLTVLVEADD